jgi:peptidyl-prolyl cis-trans isomerase B (cyclophilin B)
VVQISICNYHNHFYVHHLIVSQMLNLRLDTYLLLIFRFFKLSLMIAVLSFTYGCGMKGKDVVLETNYGAIEIKLFDDAAPVHSENFRKLVVQGFYDSLQFHRVVPHFVIQGGDPNTRTSNKTSYGEGGPGYSLPAEIGKPHLRSSVGMAREGDQINPSRRSNGSQFYICLSDLPALDGKYTVFGEVVRGMDVVDKISLISRDEHDVPLRPVYILRAYLKNE